MRLVSFSSGLQVCGIADYHSELSRAMLQLCSWETVRMPTGRVRRDMLVQLMLNRRRYAALSHKASDADGVVIEFHSDFWNHNRAGESMLPLFLRQLRRPAIAIVHEWFEPDIAERFRGSRVVRSLKGITLAALGGLDRMSDLDTSELGRVLTKHVPAFFVHSPSLQELLVDHGADPHRVHCVPHPVFEADVSVTETSEVAPQDSRLVAGRSLLIMGFAAERKGFDIALRALQRLPSDVRLIWIGGCRDASDQRSIDSLFKLADQLGVRDRFVRLGYLEQSQLQDVLQSVSVAWAPFREMTGSGSISRFISAGLPVVVSDLVPSRFLATAGAAVELVPAGDCEALAHATLQLLQNPSRLAEMQSANRTFAAQNTFASLARRIFDEMLNLTAGPKVAIS